MLEDVALGHGTHGTASGDGSHAGRYSTARALRRHGLLDGDELTDSGRKALAAAGINVRETHV
jgi:hypothetical protein